VFDFMDTDLEVMLYELTKYKNQSLNFLANDQRFIDCLFAVSSEKLDDSNFDWH